MLFRSDVFSDGEYYFDCQDGTNAPVLSDGVLTLSARQMDSTDQTTVRLKIDLRSGTPVSYTHLDVYKRQVLYSSYFRQQVERVSTVSSSPKVTPSNSRCV